MWNICTPAPYIIQEVVFRVRSSLPLWDPASPTLSGRKSCACRLQTDTSCSGRTAAALFSDQSPDFLLSRRDFIKDVCAVWAWSYCPVWIWIFNTNLLLVEAKMCISPPYRQLGFHGNWSPDWRSSLWTSQWEQVAVEWRVTACEC